MLTRDINAALPQTLIRGVAITYTHRQTSTASRHVSIKVLAMTGMIVPLAGLESISRVTFVRSKKKLVAGWV